MTPFDRWLTTQPEPPDPSWDEVEAMCSSCGRAEDEHIAIRVPATDDTWAYDSLECPPPRLPHAVVGWVMAHETAVAVAVVALTLVGCGLAFAARAAGL